MSITVLDPTYGDEPSSFRPAERLDRLDGITVGVISNGKHGTVAFFDAFAEHLRDRHGVAEVVRVIKPNYSAPAGDAIMDEARNWHALVAGIGD